MSVTEICGWVMDITDSSKRCENPAGVMWCPTHQSMADRGIFTEVTQ